MKRAEIETRIVVLEKMHAAETEYSTLATINRCLEKLIMMDADDDETIHPSREPLSR